MKHTLPTPSASPAAANSTTAKVILVSPALSQPVAYTLIKAVDYNAYNAEGLTPLTSAVHDRDYMEVTQLVQKHKADINKPDGFNMLPLERARLKRDERMEKLLIFLGADKELCDEWMDRKEVAHIWGIDYQSTLKGKNKTYKANLDSWLNPAGADLLRKHLKTFLKDSPHFTAQACFQMNLAAENAVDSTNKTADILLVTKLNDTGVPVVILAGSQSHAISYVVTKERLYVCNRGNGRDADSAITVYELPAEKITPKLFEKLRRSDYKDMEAVNTMIAGLGLKKLSGESTQRSNAKTLHCVWSSAAKPAAEALFQHYGKPEVRKEFSAHCRHDSYTNHLENTANKTKNPDKGFIKAVSDKLCSKIAAGKKFFELERFEHCIELIKKLGQRK